MTAKLSEKYVISFFKKYGYTLLDEYKNNRAYVTFKDNKNYKYWVAFGDFKNHIEKGTKPLRFAVSNPYTFDNIRIWIVENKKTFTFEGGEWKGNWSKTLFFKCNKCSEVWDTSWEYITEGTKCPYCVGKRVSPNRNLKTERPDLSEEWDYEKNNGKLPENFMPYSGKSAWWICQNGHSWNTKITNRTGGSNCPICSSSRGEEAVRRFLENNSIKFSKEQTFEGCRYIKLLRFDFYLPEYNLCVEFQGEQHYIASFGKTKEEAKQNFKISKKRDTIKRKYCKKNNIGLLEIPYWEFLNIKKILIKALNL